MILALVASLAGSVGAVARYLADGAVQDRTSGVFPAGTLVVNVAGSLVLGIVTGLTWYHGFGSSGRALVGTGFCGAFTTWSTVSWETVRLTEQGSYGAAAVTAFGGLATSLAAAGLGIVLVAAL